MRTALLAALLAAANAQALELAGVFADHMVLQREMPLRVWGQAEPGQSVHVQLAGRETRVKTGADGRWRATLAPLKAGGPHQLRVSAGGERRQLDDVLIGDVWIAAGQSNMEWRLADSDSASTEIPAAGGHPLIRHAKMPHRVSLQPLKDAPSLRWDVASPAMAGEFSAVAWHFARRVQADVSVPIGILNLSWGGTHVETWTSPRAAATDPDLTTTMQAMPTDATAFVKRRQARMRELVRGFQGEMAEVAGADPALDDKAWPTLNTPQVWESQGLPGLDGKAWLRRHITLTAAEAAGVATLHLGPVDDCDETFVNGRPVGKTCGWETPRSYSVPAGLLREGDNLIAVRVTDTGGDGGIHGPAAHLRLETAAGIKPLAGRWQARVEALQPITEPGPNDLPSLLFNGMVEAFTPFAARGVIWYQGESNSALAARYAQAFPRLINDWRAQWREQGQRGRLPFYFVQLSSFGPRPPLPEGSAFAELRDAQRRTLSLPATGMAVSIDVGDANDIHPRDKKTVGERLARIALAQTYGQSMPFKGPTLRASRALPDGSFELTFNDIAGGLSTRGGGPLLGFAVAGADQRFVPARAEIVGANRVRVRSEAVAKPSAVRYAWGDTPLDANLVDGAGLPATPWRSDSWPLVTRDIRPEF